MKVYMYIPVLVSKVQTIVMSNIHVPVEHDTCVHALIIGLVAIKALWIMTDDKDSRFKYSTIDFIPVEHRNK